MILLRLSVNQQKISQVLLIIYLEYFYWLIHFILMENKPFYQNGLLVIISDFLLLFSMNNFVVIFILIISHQSLLFTFLCFHAFQYLHQ